jgi:hypothetical protein
MTNQFAIACAVSLLLSAAVAARTATVPLQHIETARMLLDQIDDKSLKKNARERMAQLRKMFGEMVEAYAASTADWRTKFSAVESELTRIIGGGRGPGLESVRAGAGGEAAVVPNRAPVEPSSVAQPGGIVGAAGGAAVVGDIGVKDLDPAIREQLRQFRLEVELFFASALTDSAGVSTSTRPVSTPSDQK